MEFHDKLQQLRKQKNMTQEQLAQALYVSRTAVSKWESGRGYPNIDSLKAIARLFSVSVDELLSGEELLTVAEKNQQGNRDLVFSLLDLCSLLLLFLPFFGQKSDGAIQEVSLLTMQGVSAYIQLAYWAAVSGLTLTGALTLILRNCTNAFWLRIKCVLSVAINALGVLVFIVCQQPYAASFLFVFLMIKVLLMRKRA